MKKNNNSIKIINITFKPAEKVFINCMKNLLLGNPPVIGKIYPAELHLELEKNEVSEEFFYNTNITKCLANEGIQSLIETTKGTYVFIFTGHKTTMEIDFKSLEIEKNLFKGIELIKNEIKKYFITNPELKQYFNI